MRRRGLLNSVNNAGIVALSGAAGRGFAQAGRDITGLGNRISADDRYAAKLKADEKLRLANEEAAKKQRDAASSALRAKNYAANPHMAELINKQYGITGDLAHDPTAPTLANANLGLVDLGTPKEPAKRKVKSKFTDNNDYLNIIYDDGTIVNTKRKRKNYQTSQNKRTVKGVPDGYVFAGNFNIGDDLNDELATSGAYYTDKSGIRYVNVNKYNNLKKLGDTKIK